MKKTLLHFRNPDSTLDLNTQLSKFFAKGLVDGGEVLAVYPNSIPQVTVSPFKLIGQDGMVVIETSDTETITLPTNQTTVIVFKSKYIPNDDPEIGFEHLEISTYNSLSASDKEDRTIFALVTTAGPADPPDISYDLRDVIDPVSRNILRGVVEVVADLPPAHNRLGDAWIVESGIPDPANGMYVWKGTQGWVNITDALSLSTILQQHRSNLFADEIHMTNDQALAALGTFGSPGFGNEYVTSMDPRVPTQDENDALVGLSQNNPVPPSAINRYVTSAYNEAEPTEVLLSGVGAYIILSPTNGPFFVGLGAGMGTALKYFGIYDPIENREYVNSLGQAIQITGIYKDLLGPTPLDPSAETSVGDSNGFWNDTLYISYTGVVDGDLRVRYGKELNLENISRGKMLLPAPSDAQTSAEVLERLQEISGRLFDDPMQSGESNVELRSIQLDLRRYLNTTTASDMVVPGTAMAHLRQIPDIAPDFAADFGEILEFGTSLAPYWTLWSPTDVATFDPLYAGDAPVVAVIVWQVGAVLPAIEPGWLWEDDLGNRFRILSYNPSDRAILIYTGGNPVNVNNANGNQSKIYRANNPRQLEITQDHATTAYREFFVVDDLVPLKDQFEALPPGGVSQGSYLPPNNFSLISDSTLPSQGSATGSGRGRPLFYIAPKQNGNRYENRVLLVGNWKSDQVEFPRQVVGDMSQGAYGIEYTGRLSAFTLYTVVRTTMPYGFRVFIDGAYNHAASKFLTGPEIAVGLPPSNMIENFRGDLEKRMQPITFSDLGITDNLVHTIRVEITEDGTEPFPLYGLGVYFDGAQEDAGRTFVSTDFVHTDTAQSFSPVVSTHRGQRVVRYIDRTTKARASASMSMPTVFDNAVNISAAATTFNSATLAQSANPGDVFLFTSRPLTAADSPNYTYRRIMTVDRFNGTLTIDAALGFSLPASGIGRAELVFRVPTTPIGNPVASAPSSAASTEYARFFVSDWSVGLSRDIDKLSDSAPENRVTVLEDGSTSLAVSDCRRISTGIEGFTSAIRLENLTSYMVINAWGTRQDVVFCGAGGTPATVQIEIDGQHTYSVTVPNDGMVRHTLFFDGAPQSHTVRIGNPSVAQSVSIGQWMFHTIKAPAINGTAIAEYEVPRNASSSSTNFFDFAPTANTNPYLVSNSGLRVFDLSKYGATFYQGTTGTADWALTQDYALSRFASVMKTDRLNAITEIEFVGSHFELFYLTDPNGGIAQMFLDGVVASAANYPTSVFAQTGKYLSGTGQLDQYDTTVHVARVVFAGLPFGRHTFRLQNTLTKNVASGGYSMSVLAAAENSGTAVLQRRYVEDQKINRLHMDSVRDLRQFLSVTADQVGIVSAAEDEAQAEETTLGYIASAYGMSDGSGTPLNCTIGVAMGVSYIDLGFSYTIALNPGTTAGDLDVFVDGQALPRRVVGTTQDAWYEEDSMLLGRLNFHANLSGGPMSIDVRRKAGTVDTSTTNTARILGGDGIVVGTPAHVSAGAADYSSLSDAITAAAPGTIITVLGGTNIVESVSLDKRIFLKGYGYDSRLTGTFTLTANCDFATISNLYVSQFILASGAVGNQVLDCFWDTNPTDANSGGSNRITGMLTV